MRVICIIQGVFELRLSGLNLTNPKLSSIDAFGIGGNLRNLKEYKWSIKAAWKFRQGFSSFLFFVPVKLCVFEKDEISQVFR